VIFLVLLTAFTVDSILNQPELSTAQTSICIINLETDSIVYARNSQKVLIPASNMKIITTAASLYYLGPEYRYVTRCAVTGMVWERVLKGNVVLIGGGDPTIDYDDISRFVSAIKAMGVSRIEGDIIIDDQYFQDISFHGNTFTSERLPTGWAWHYLDARYAAEVSALSLNQNYINVKMKAQEIGAPAQVALVPETKYVTLVNTMITKTGEDSIIIYRRPENNVIYVDGGIGEGRTRIIPVAVKDPAMFTGHSFQEKLTDEGIVCTGTVRRSYDEETGNSMLHEFDVIDSVLSAPLIDILLETNTESVNLYAEVLLKTLGARYYGEGSFHYGVHMLKRFLGQCGADPNEISLWDGSGLSRHNLVSAYHLALVLRYMYLSKYADRFFELLPAIGEGTLEKRFGDFEGIVRAKTGSLHAVSCLSGYVKIDETDYCFALLFNNYACARKKIENMQEQIVLALYQYFGGDVSTKGD
jgi:D-alanyl-D-alanine carboxypeptidase/D-alanyl-D-alanine-endopeptidase (penicillin-binding protein 4)